MNCGEMLRKTGRYQPDNLAIWMDGEGKNYGEVYERACRLVNALRSLGIERNDRVATLGPNAPRALDEIAGLALGGFCRVPLHYRNALELQKFMIDWTETRVLITDQKRYEEIKGLLPELSTLEHVIVDGGADGALDYEGFLAAQSPEDPHVYIPPDDTMLHMAFTSGTTGRPKATVQTHRSWLRVTSENMIMMPRFTEESRYLAAGPLSHAASTVIFALVGTGAASIVMPNFDPARAGELIEQHKITFTTMVPTMVQMLVNEPSLRDRDLSSMQVILATGAPITERTIRDTREVFGDVLYIGFGQSEGIPGTILSPQELALGLDGIDPTMLRTTGKAVFSSVVKIVDDGYNELPPNTLGEIAIDVPGTMKEFWRQPEQTAERIAPDGFLLTRDIGQMDERGYLFLADRKEDMIISGGFNIAPAELENAIATHPSVREVAVVGVPHPTWGETPRAVVVLAEGESASEDEIIEWAKERVGSMKKPTSVIFRDSELPKSNVGKVLRRKIREEEWPLAATENMIGGA